MEKTRFKTSEIIESLSRRYCNNLCDLGISGYNSESLCKDCIVYKTVEYVKGLENEEKQKMSKM